ncbi:MAG: outer membrane protein transport protein [Myxococcales bacterium]|nr:outer membrane protein transport protein [Myxococcales bacterium]
MGRKLASVAVASGLALGPLGAGANGFENEYPDNGARALGRAGAFAARADDPTAIYYNPAGLGRQKGFSLLLSSNVVSLTHEFEAADDVVSRRSRDLGAISQEHPASFGPMFAGHFDIEGLDDFDFGFGVYGPSSTMLKQYPDQIPVNGVGSATTPDDNIVNWLRPNGMLVEAQMLLAYPTVSVAYQVLDELRLGLSLQAAIMQATLTKSFGPPVPALAELSFTDWFTPTAIIGVHYAPVPWLEIGASVRPGFQIEAKGKARIDTYEGTGPNGEGPFIPTGEPIELLDANGQPDDGLDFTYNHPLVARGAVRFVQPTWDVELDYVFQQNSRHEAFTVDFHAAEALVTAANFQSPVPTVTDVRKYEDTHEVRLGGDYQVLPGIFAVRAGGAYATGASPTNYTNLDFPALDRWSAHAGFGINAQRIGLEFDIGYAYVGMVEREVTDSQTTLIDITKPNGIGAPVGNGTFSGHYHIFGASALWHVW